VVIFHVYVFSIVLTNDSVPKSFQAFHLAMTCLIEKGSTVIGSFFQHTNVPEQLVKQRWRIGKNESKDEKYNKHFCTSVFL